MVGKGRAPANATKPKNGRVKTVRDGLLREHFGDIPPSGRGKRKPRDGSAGVTARRPGRQGGHIVEMQRRRLLTATSELVFERGVQAVTIALISARAGVSRKTFYDSFDGREGCLLEAFEEAVHKVTAAVDKAAVGEEKWVDRVRAGLVGLLSFLDEDPVAGRLVIVEALGAGVQTLEARRRVLARIVAIVDRGRTQPRASRDAPPLTAEGVVGAVFSVIHARMLASPPPALEGRVVGKHDTQPLIGLAGSLMAMIVQPYLGPTAAKGELARSVPAARRSSPRLLSDPFKDLPIRLTYRTAQVLSSIAATPGASSKQVATASGITDEGQTSRLLARLQRVGLIQNTGAGAAKGEANAWTLTTKGHNVHTAITQQTGQD